MSYINDYPDRDLYRKYYHNLFTNLADFNRKKIKVMRRSIPSVQVDPPAVLRNPSQFCVFATVRSAILNRWSHIYLSQLDAVDENDIDDLTPVSRSQDDGGLPKVVALGLKTMFSVILDSRTVQPSMCKKALISLLEVLQNYAPEELLREPGEVLDTVFTILLEICCGPGPGPNAADDGMHLTSLACSCLVSLIIARGNTTQMLKAISALLMSPEALARQNILLPDILINFQRIIQSLVLGTTSSPYWITHGIPQSSFANEFNILMPKELLSLECVYSAYSMISDGQYIYITTSRGFVKIGTGYGGTIKSFIYQYNKDAFGKNPNILLMYYKNKIYARLPGKSYLYIIDKDKLKVSGKINIEPNLISKNTIFFSDSHNIGIISPTNEEGLLVKLFDITTEANGVESLEAVKTISLNLTKRYTYALGWATYEEPIAQKLLEPLELENSNNEYDESAAIVAGQEFSLMRMISGKVYFTGKASALAYKGTWSNKAGRWTELTLGKNQRIVHIAVGHEGQHAVLVTEDGQALFTGTARRGEDGDTPKSRRQPKPVKIKSFSKLENETIVFAACNYGTSGFVTREGRLFMFGKDTYNCDASGQLELSDETIIQVALGKAHGVALNSEGVVYTFGINNRGQCGRDFGQAKDGNEQMGMSSPCHSHAIKENLKICDPGTHKWKQELCMICMNCNQCTGFSGNCTQKSSPKKKMEIGQVCGCGEGDSGCEVCGICRSCAKDCTLTLSNVHHLGHLSTSSKTDNSPVKTTRLYSDACARKTIRKSSSSTQALSKYSSVAMRVKYGVLQGAKGSDDNTSGSEAEREGNSRICLAPDALVFDKKVAQIACGLHHTVMLTDFGEVYTFGSNQFGQLGTRDNSAHGIVKVNVPQSIQVAAGSNHTVILTASGEVYTIGSNNRGQLGRIISDTSSSEVSRISTFEPSNGCKVRWIGASGDETFIKLDQALINISNLLSATITGNKDSLVILPCKVSDTFKCITINKSDGACNSYNANDQVDFLGSLACLDPVYDIFWKYDPEKNTIKCYNILGLNATNLQQCSTILPLEENYETTLTNYGCEDAIKNGGDGKTQTKSLSILSSELALPKTQNTFITRSHAALHLLACLDTLFLFNTQKLPLIDDSITDDILPLPKPVSKEEYQSVYRFSCHGNGWGYPSHAIEAIRFMTNCDLILGGFALFGGRGEYVAKIKLFDIGYEGGEQEVDGETLRESDEVLYQCPAREKFSIFFDVPVKIMANKWYVAWARITGPSSDCGSLGQASVATNGCIFQFKASKKSNNGTNIVNGQIPCLLFKNIILSNCSKNNNPVYDPVQMLSLNFGKHIKREGLECLHSLLQWSWNTIINGAMEKYSQRHHNKIYAIKHEEKLAFISKATLKLIRSYLNEIYPLSTKKKMTEECEYLVEGIYEIRKLLMNILSDDVISNKPETSQNSSHSKLLISILKECHQTFEELFHVFFPTSYLKWSILCTLLANVEDGVCKNKPLLLSAVLASLNGRVNLRQILPISGPVIPDECAPNVRHKFPTLVEKICSKTMEEGIGDISRWTLDSLLNCLLDLVITPVKMYLKLEAADTLSNETSITSLVKHCSHLLTRIVAELTFNAVNPEESEDPGSSGISLCTPNRFVHFNPACNWHTSKGFPDAVCFKVDRAGIFIVGVAVYGGVGNYNYELEILCDQSGPANNQLHQPAPQNWKSLEYTRGIFNADMNDLVEIKFVRHVPIKEHVRYAIRLWNFGGPTRSGDQGVPSVRGPDGTTFTFSRCTLSMNGTTPIRGQIPSLLYIRDSQVLPSNDACEAVKKVPRAQIIHVAQCIIRKCAQLLQEIRNDFSPEHLKRSTALEDSPCLTSLIPLTLAHLSKLTDPESCVEILNLIHHILPDVAALNLFEKETYSDLSHLLMTTSSHYVSVESQHPYKSASVKNYRVSFPKSVAWMVLEMDPQSGTAQPEDSLTIYIQRMPNISGDNCDGNQPSIMNDMPICTDGSKLTEWDWMTFYKKKKQNENENGENNSYVYKQNTYVPITHKMTNMKSEWPQKSIVVPGNEVIFSMETASDYLKDDKGNRYGFKCLVVGYEDISNIPSEHIVSTQYSALSRLEGELSYLGGMCAASLISPCITTFPGFDEFTSLPPIRDDECEHPSPATPHLNRYFDDSENVILSRGLALAREPTIKQALSGQISYSFNSKEHQFLQDLIKCTDDTAGGRLARWLQPEPYVDPRRCKLIQPASARCGEEVKLTLLLHNQHGAAVYSDKLNVEMTAFRADLMQSDTTDLPQQSSSYSVHPPPPLDFPYQVTVKENMRFQCISMMKAFQGYSLEELRIATPIGARPREVITVLNDESKFYDRQVTAVWVPMTYGRYSIQCTIDEYSIDEPLIVNVNEPLGGVLPSNPKIMEESPKPSKIRKFMEDDSSGLRIRAHPSLQSEQVGLIPTGCSITFDNVVTNADGVWLRLNSESSSTFCNYIPNDVEAWVLQYNHHLRKSLLHPSESGYIKLYDVNKRSVSQYSEKLNVDHIDSSLDKFQIVRQADVRTSYKKDSPVIGVLEVHDIVYGKKTHTSMLETWVMLDERSVERYGYLSDTGECWVLRHALETITHTGCSDTDESADLSDTDFRTQSRHYRVENTAHQKERMVSMKQKYKEKRKKDKKSYLRSTLPEDAENQIDDLTVYTDSSFREGGNGNASNSASAIPGYNKDIAVYFIDSTTNETESRVTQIGTQTSPENSVTSFENASSDQSSNTCQPSQALPESPGANRNKFGRKRTYSTDSNATVLLEENKMVLCGYAKSPSKAESFRAMFAAFMWHEGIVHDAMTCASYLKFYPSLPKQGSQVVTRHLPHSLATRQMQRHSVEVSNAGNYLNIQASTLESLTRSALNANANRARSKRTTSITNADVAMIREEDGAGPSGECTAEDKGDVVRVLPAAFRALLALWDAMSEMLPDPKYIDRNDMLFNDKMPFEEHGLQNNKSDKNDLSEIFFSVSSNGTYKESKKTLPRRKDCKPAEKNGASNKYLCELCCESVDLPVSEHMLRNHKGCGGPSSGLGYSYTGIYVGGWFGICGLPGHGYMGPGYVFCGTCRDKCLKNKKNKETTSSAVSCSYAAEQSEQNKLSQQSDQYGSTSNYHFVIKRNAMFLLELASAAGNEKKSSGLTGNNDETQYTTPNTPWLPIPPYQCVEVLSQLQTATPSAAHGLDNLNNEYSPSSSNILREDYQYREDDNMSDIYFADCRPSTSAMGSRVQRSVSMGPDTTKELSHDGMAAKRKMINQGNDPINNSSLLCQPSAALQALVGISSEEYYNSEVSSLTPLKVNKKLLMTRPAIGFLTKKKDINKIKSNMINTVKIGAMRKYGLECMNWMIHAVTQPLCLHDLMWWFSHAMNQYHTSMQFDDTQLQENANGEGPSNGNNICGWKESMECLGSGMNAKLRQSLHALLQSISDLMPLLPPASPLLLQAVRCWALDFTAADHTFLHRSQVFNNISKILSHSEDDFNEDNLATSMNGQFAGMAVSLPDKQEKAQVWGCRDITKWCEINVSSRQAMIESLTDGSTETFWESGEEDRTKPKWVQITVPLHLDDSPSLICLHIDNTRDNGNKILLISFLYGSNAEDLQHIKDYDATVKTNGWIFCSLPYVGYNPVIRCEVRGPDGSVRIRQIRVLGQPAPSPSYRPYSPITTLQHHTEVETLRVFRLITSQVFGKLINSDFDEHSDFQRSGVNNDLKEHMVGILFSRSKLTNLQKQVMMHIVTAISSEAKRARESWENIVYSDNLSPDLTRADNAEVNTPLSLGQRVDEYCFEMLSMVLALSGSHLGRSYLSEHLFLIRDLLSLLHTGSARVQRQVISVLRRMIGEVTPQRMTLALASGIPSSPSITFIDHLVSCISKALRVQIKIKMTGTGQTVQYVPPSSSLQPIEQVPPNKTAMYTVVMRSSLQDIHPSYWFLRGTMSHRHARLVSDLLSDMIQGKMSKAWAQTTKVAIAENIFTLTVLKDEDRAPDTCIAMPNLWRALGSLCVLDEEQVERLSSRGWTDLVNTFVNVESAMKSKEKSKQSSETRPFCVNHDDGETYAIMECQVCGKMCQECDRFLHLHRRTRSHQRQVCKEEESAIRVDLHEGCGRVKLFWLLALVDQRTLKSLVEFRSGSGNVQRTDSALAGWKGTSGISTGICRFCGAQSNIGLLAIGNVCADHECQEHSKDACVRILSCGHLCGGIAGESCCLPCLHGCASNLPQSAVLMDEAAGNSATTPLRPPLRQDAEDMCMICFTDPLSAAPAIQLKCGHVFHLHCSKKAVINKWVGPRITFSFSQCPICKEDMFHVALEDLLRPIRELQDEVKRKALVRLEYEGLKDAAAIATRYQNMPSEYAMDRYAYYVCFKCQKAYYGGEARCDAEGGGANVDFDPTELVCGGCSDVARAQMCPKHGADFLEYKCRFCCSVAVFFCLGDTHFCNGCHEEFQRLRKIPLAMLPQCPAGAKGKQLEGSRDDCPLRIRHPPTGTEFALGCGICRNSHTF